MRKKDLEILEVNRFLKELSEFTINEKTKEKVLSVKPEIEKSRVEKKVLLTKEFLSVLEKEGYIPLSEYPDISESLNLLSIQDSVLSSQEILDIAQILNISRTLKNFLSDKVKYTQHLYRIYRELYSSRETERIIKDSIDESGMVKDTASRDLAGIRKSIKDVEKQILSILENIINNQKYSDIIQERLITVRRDRYVIPVKQNFSKKIQGIIQDRSSSGQTVYLEPVSVIELNNRLSDLKLREHIEVRKVLKFLTDILRDKINSIRKTFEGIIQLDYLYTVGKYSKKFSAVFPEFSDRFELLEARHPLFLILEKDFHPIDIKVNRGVVITGPNTGGKTVALKTAGLMSILVQSGIPVPVAEGSKIPLVDGVFADIGDMQSIEQNLSTFSAHIVNIKEILEEITENSLILLDELIPGTDPDEGSAIGIGILEKLKKTGCFIMATTHFKQIKIYALSDDYFDVASVGFDREKLSPTYTIHYNSVGESMAFYIAERLGFDFEILETARKYVDETYLKFEKAIKELEFYKTNYESELSKVKELKKQLKEEKERYAELSKELEEQKKSKWEIVQKEAEEYLKNIRKEGYRILQEIKTSKSGKRLEEFIKEEKGKRFILEKEGETPQIDIGDKVKLKGKNTTGEVISIRENKAHVNFNGIKIWTKLSDLEKAGKEKDKKEVRFSFRRKKEDYFRPEIKLIGKTKEEAIKELEQFIDRAILEGFTTVRVIHGYGTGVLRKAVREFLDRSPYSVKYEDAPYNEGGMGVTIVHIK